VFQKYLPGDWVHLMYSSCGHLHETENPRDYLWLNKGQHGIIVSGLGRPSIETRGEIEQLVLISGKLFWIESDCLDHLFVNDAFFNELSDEIA